MTIDQIETFLAVVRHNGFRHASCALFLTQPSVRTRIKNFEKELNVPLFIHTDRTISLYENGKILLPYAEGITRLCHEARAELAKICTMHPI
ncbi:LysR family transcriptional regulator [Sporolactobacillus sp. STSJ-5]|uniref:LysR family transcriptional regulator n=1 Tax=Sporolactobacillus sp. STSJ-5 TaxID=2965076 RepID=UPI00351D4636